MQNKKILLATLLSASVVTVEATATVNTASLKDESVEANQISNKQAAVSSVSAQFAAPHDYYNAKGHVHN